MRKLLHFSVFLWIYADYLNVNCDSTIQVLGLDSGWTATNANASINIPVEVPGTIYTDLEMQGVLNDSYYRFNDINYRWVGYDNWTYFNIFQVPDNILSKKYVYLVAEGLDTVSTVILNGQQIGQTDNMFVRYRWQVKEILKNGSNDLQIKFISPVTYALNQQQDYLSTFGYDVPPDCPMSVQHGECHVNFIRKIQSQFSWDWGPAFPTVGIWQPIQFEALDSCIIRDIVTYPSKTADSWEFSVGVYFDCSTIDVQTGSLNLNLATPTTWFMTSAVTLNPDNSGLAFVNISSLIPASTGISPWWPNGYGNQTLYALNVSYVGDNNLESTSKVIKVGFRTIELIQDPVPNDYGNYFYFKINDVPVFMKGSNWIPADSFPPRVSPDYLRNLLQSAADAHMNCLRVWGGGQYEKNKFYELTDELGIMIWQDLLYASSMYPVDGAFIDSVKLEVTQQIRRLQHFASILVWSGNNENEANLAVNYFGTDSNYSLYYGDYVKLYVNTTMVIAQQEDTSRPYITSSPTNGVESVAEGYVADNPADSHYGDVHFYTDTEDGWDWKIFPRPRFVSEYGFQSWSSFETLSKVSIVQDWNWNSDFMESRQHHQSGNDNLIHGIQYHMDLPNGCNSNITNVRSAIYSNSDSLHTASCSTLDGYKGMLYQSQIYQAMSIKTETEYYRRARSELINGEGYTMGTLYWQLDDIWQGASWASIEYGGKWKILHYFAVQFYAPILVSPFIDDAGETTIVYICSDTNDQLLINLQIYLYKWNSFTPVTLNTISVNVWPNAAVKVYENSITQQYQASNCSAEECFFYYVLTDESDQTQIGPINFIFPTSFKTVIGLSKANITVLDVEYTGSNDYQQVFQILINSDAIAPFVFLEAIGIHGRFSDNGFLMVQPQVQLEFYSWDNVTLDQLADSLNIVSLMDLY